MFPLLIQNKVNKKELFLLKRFMVQQPQFYPDFNHWVSKKCLPHIEKGIYQSIIIIANIGEVIGDAIYTQNISDTNIKLKNFRIDPLYRNRDLGHFLLRQVMHETNYQQMILDVTVDNFAGTEFFIRNEFNIIRKEKLYLPTQDEYIMLHSGKFH